MKYTRTILFVLFAFCENVYSSEDMSIAIPESNSQLILMNIAEMPMTQIFNLSEYPNVFFTDQQNNDGLIVLYILSTVYFFVLLSVVCNDYFLPSVECVCEDLNIPKDVAAATFMAGATIAPEFFTNVISSFVVESDVGLGGVLGSLMFNVLGVGAFAGMSASHYVQLDWWPITRDCILYAFSVCILMSIAWDGQVTLRESASMVSLISIYILVLLFNKHLMHCMKWILEINLNCCRVNSYDMPTSFVESNLKNAITLQPNDLCQITNIDEKPKTLHGSLSKSSLTNLPIFMIYTNPSKQAEKNGKTTENKSKSLWSCPMSSKLKTLWWIYTWPIQFLLSLTIPNPKTYRRIYPLTFIMCVIWIGLNSYMIIWMMSLIGCYFGISEAVMGLTFLAAGNCTPEILSSILMIRKGERGVGVSNSLGSSSLDIFLSLGGPWFVRNLLNSSNENPNPAIQISGTETTILLLMVSVIFLYVVLTVAKYRLSKNVGLSLLLGYIVLAMLSVTSEMNVFSSITNI